MSKAIYFMKVYFRVVGTTNWYTHYVTNENCIIAAQECISAIPDGVCDIWISEHTNSGYCQLFIKELIKANKLPKEYKKGDIIRWPI